MKRTRTTGVPLGPLTPNDSLLINQIARVPKALFRTLLLRGAILWLLARLMGAAVLSVGAQNARPLLPGWVVVMTAILTVVDLHRRRELSLLHNLGIATSRAVAIVTVPAIMLETGLVMLIP